MSLTERTGTRDLAFSRWHRTRLSAECAAIDVDLLGYCRGCLAPLYVIESTRAEHKDTSVVMSTADRLGVPGFLVRYVAGPDGIASVVRAYGRPARDGRRHLIAADDAFAVELLRIRQEHTCQEAHR